MPDYSAFSDLGGRFGGGAQPIASAFAANPNAFAAAPVEAPVDIAAEMRRNKLLQEQERQRVAVKNAFMQAGSDPQGAQTALVQAGALDQAEAVGKMAAQKRQQDLRTQAQTQVQGGDTTGAARTLATGGMGVDAKALTTIDDDRLAQAQKKADTFGALAHYFQTMPQEQRATAWQQYAPVMVQQGLITADQAANPKLDDANLGAVQAQALGLKTTLEQEEKRREANKPVSVAPGGSLVNPQTGAVVASIPDKPDKPQYMKVTDPRTGEEKIVEVGGGPRPGAQGQPQAQPQGQRQPQGGDPNAPRGIRNNNPLNVTALPNGQQWNGQSGVDGNYATFSTPEAGIAAADRNLQSYAQKHGINTLSGVISRWAPSSENDTAAYIATVSKDLNVDPNQPLNLADPGVRRAVLQSMSKVETGRSGAMGQQPPQGGPQAAPQPDQSGGRVVYSSGNGAPPAANAGVTGPDFLKGVEPQRASQLKALSEGRMQFPSGMALSKPYWQSMLSDLAQYDPTFDAANPTTRSKTRADFTSGKSAQNITSMNTAIGHLGSLDKAIDTLGNSGFRAGNQVGQWIKGQVGQDKNIKQFETSRDAVANELTRVFRGSGGAEADVKAWRAKLDEASSPETLHGVVNQMVDLLGSRIAALGEQYTQGMGTSAVPLDLLIPKAADTIKHLAGGGSAADLPAFRVSGQPGGPQSQPRPQGGAAPPPRPGMVVKGYQFNGGNPADQANWVKVQ